MTYHGSNRTLPSRFISHSNRIRQYNLSHQARPTLMHMLSHHPHLYLSIPCMLKTHGPPERRQVRATVAYQGRNSSV